MQRISCFNSPWRRIDLYLIGLAAALMPVTVATAVSQTEVVDPAPVLLPSPTGPHAVGKTIWHWPDPARSDALTPEPGDARELMVQAWYPAESSGTRPQAAALPLYAPLSRAYEDVRDEAVPGARFRRLDTPAPVVILCPGRGAAAYSYSALAEDLASHGYAVFAFDAPHTGFVRYPDGRTVQPSDAFQIPIEILTGPYEHADSFFAQAEELGEGDFAFVVRRIAALNANDPTGRFTGMLDLSRMGAIAHSMGGRACGAGVHRDGRFKALVSADGVPPRVARLGGLDQAALMLVSADMPDMAMPNFLSVIPQRRNDVYIARLPNAGHNSLRDGPYLRAEDAAARSAAAEQLDVIRSLVRRFLDAYTRQGGEFAIAPHQTSHAHVKAHKVSLRRD